MAKDARQPIAGWRNEALVLPIRVVGLDVTGMALRAQVRLAPGTPGAPLIDLTTQTNASAEGVRLASVTTTDGVPTSNLTLRINKSTMQALPASGELGSPTALSYALQIGTVTRLYGAFVVLDSSIDSDTNPTNRLPAYGSPAAAFAVADGLTMTIGNDGVTVVIDGIGRLAEILVGAQDIADAAKASANTAAVESGKANVARVASEGAAAASVAAAQEAGAYKAAIDQAGEGLPTGTVLTIQAASRDIMRGIASPATGTQAMLGQDGAVGLHIAGPYAPVAAQADADVEAALIVRSTADPARVWARPISRRQYDARWWLGSGSAWTNADIPLNRAIQLMEPHSDLHFPAGDIVLGQGTTASSNGIKVDKPGQQMIGAGRGSTLVRTDATITPFQLRRDFTAVRNMSLKTPYTNQSANNIAAVWISQTGVANQQPITRAEVTDCTLDSSIGVLVIPADNPAAREGRPVQEVGAVINDCIYTGNYQGISCFQSLGVRINRFKAVMMNCGSGQFNGAVRNNGGVDTVVDDLEIVSDGTLAFGVRCSGSVSGNGRKIGRDFTVSRVRMSGLKTAGIRIDEITGFCTFEDVLMDNRASPGGFAIYLEASPEAGSMVGILSINKFRAFDVKDGFAGTGVVEALSLTNAYMRGRKLAGSIDNPFAFTGFESSSLKDLMLKNCDFDWPQQQVYSGATVTGTKAGERLIIVGNRFPTVDNPNVTGPRISIYGSGTVITSLNGGAVTPAEITPAGDNGCFPPSAG